MLITVNLFCNDERLLIVFFSFTVLAKVTVNFCQVVVTCCYVTMLFTVNLFFNDESLLIIFFNVTVLAKDTVNSSQVPFPKQFPLNSLSSLKSLRKFIKLQIDVLKRYASDGLLRSQQTSAAKESHETNFLGLIEDRNTFDLVKSVLTITCNTLQ